MFAFFFSLFSLGVLYHSSDHSDGVTSCWISGSAGIAGMGVLLLVLRWWMGRFWRTTLGAVASWDVVGVPTLGGVGESTLGGGRFFKISVSCLTIFACLTFISVGRDSAPSNALTSSSVANNVLSSLDSIGCGQWVRKSFVVAAIWVARVLSMK